MIAIAIKVVAAAVLLVVAIRIGNALRRAKNLKQLRCVVVNGQHELYRAYTDTRMFQECLLCGYDTPGVTIDRRDRRLHLVANNPPRRQQLREALEFTDRFRAKAR